MSIKIPSLINWWDLVDIIPVRLESECPQKKVSSFQRNGKSTSLGRLNVYSVEIGMTYHIRTLEMNSEELKPTRCLFKKEKDVAEFDIGDWEYNTFLKSFVWETTLGELLNHHVIFLELFSGTFLNSVSDIGDYKFINKNHFYINIGVCSPTELDKVSLKVKKFTFESKSTFSTRCYDKEYIKQEHRYYRPAEVSKSSKNIIMEKSLT
ncbi:unnamed protein product [Ambrosiozyma monospora]|uniref:Unnamed protein product n=1 Tax=Ambrosiozyma monospora TaxID=43982 RepID=A0ACB5TAW3_AMBMO|nr:unnamed protein product [Ambrosiozyma monospora]